MNWSPSSRRKAWHRLRDAAPEPWVLAHSRAVEALAAAIGQAATEAGHTVNGDVLLQGAVLHDIGRSVTHDVRHACIGADILRDEGWPEPVVRCVECHTGAGIGREEAAALGLPDRDMVPVTLEERIVCHADNLHSGAERLGLKAVLAKYQAKGLAEAGAAIADLHITLGSQLRVDLETLPYQQLPEEIAFAA